MTGPVHGKYRVLSNENYNMPKMLFITQSGNDFYDHSDYTNRWEELDNSLLDKTIMTHTTYYNSLIKDRQLPWYKIFVVEIEHGSVMKLVASESIPQKTRTEINVAAKKPARIRPTKSLAESAFVVSWDHLTAVPNN